MKKKMMAKTISSFTVAVLIMGTIAGCGKAAEEVYSSGVLETIAEEEVAKADSFDEAVLSDQSYGVNYQQYENPNGWSVQYDDAYINVMQQDDEVFFVYSGEGVGSNLIDVYYEPEVSAKDVVDGTAMKWANDNTIQNECIFPGTEDVTGYWAVLPPAEEGSGYYENIIARDYKGGCLVFETIGHVTGDDELDMMVSDNLAMVIDSVKFG